MPNRIVRFQSNVPFMGHSRKPSGTLDHTDEPTLYSIAVEGFMRELGLKESEKKLLESHVELREAHPGVTILTEGKSEVMFAFYFLLRCSETNFCADCRTFVWCTS